MAHPVLSVVQPFGWAWLGVAAVCLIGGIWLDWSELIVLGIFLIAVLAFAALFVIGRSTYLVDIELPRTRVRVGDAAEAVLTVSNDGARRLGQCLFIAPVGADAVTIAVPHLKPGQFHREQFSLPTWHRQVMVLGPARSSRGDALGLFKREAEWTDSRELFIHPDTIALDQDATGFLKDLEGLATDTLSSSDIAFHALRDYEVGDDLRHVHWPTSARVGRLMVRQFEETRRSHLVVCLSMTPEDYTGDADFELACSTAASVAVSAIRNHVKVTLQTPHGALHATTTQGLLDECARLEFGGVCDNVVLVSQAAAAQALDASIVVVVTGDQISGARLHTALQRFPVDVIGSAIRCRAGADISRSAISDNPIITIGGLGDLPRAVGGLVPA